MVKIKIKLLIISVLLVFLLFSCQGIAGASEDDAAPVIIDFSDNGDGSARVVARDDVEISAVLINSQEYTDRNTGTKTDYEADIPLAEGDNLLVIRDSAGQEVSQSLNVDLDVAVSVSLSSSQVQHNHDAAYEVTATVDAQNLSYSYGRYFADNTAVAVFTGSSFGIDVDWVGIKQISLVLYDDSDNVVGSTASSVNLEGLNTVSAPSPSATYFMIINPGDMVYYTVPKSDLNNDSLILEVSSPAGPANVTDEGSFWSVDIDTSVMAKPSVATVSNRVYDGHEFSSSVNVTVDLIDG